MGRTLQGDREGALRTILLVLTVASLTACNLCSDEVVSTVSSPDGHNRAVWLVRDCGATTDWATHVTVERKSVVGWSHETIFVTKGDRKVDIHWVNEGILEIDCPSCTPSNVFKKEAEWKGVHVNYKLID
jgi:hypothetical protein